MDHSASKASDPERRASVRTARRVSVQDGHGGHDGDDDDYSLFALGGMVADGFRPQTADTNHHASSFQQADSSARPDSSVLANPLFAREPASPPRLPQAKRSSISKPPRTRDSFTLRHDGATGSSSQGQGAAMSRVSSASTESPYFSNEAPYDGPSGPSHPYQMYPQSTRLARTLSVATTSTAPPPPETAYDGPRGPSHPYSLYPQNPVEGSSAHPVPAIPVGFTNTPDQYERRIGPGGEEIADIIGPDGHTEELPPYTRYPDEAYALKIRASEASQNHGARPPCPVAAAAAGSASSAAMRSIPAGAGGIGLAPHNPEFDSASASDLNSPESRHSSRSFTQESHHSINTAAAVAAEKKPLNKYQKLAKRKVFGVVPYWAICLTCFAIVIVAIVTGAVVGSIFAKHKGPKSSSNSASNQKDSPTVTVTFDATPIPTPTDLPSLPTGLYDLSLNLNKSPNTCFNDTTQTAAWGCNIIFGFASEVQMSITPNAPQLGKGGSYEVNINCNQSLTLNANVLAYGAQPPIIDPAMTMELVNDTFDLGRGPAWFRMLPYNKTVIVPESGLVAPSAGTARLRRRDLGDGFLPSPGDFMRKGVAQTGDKPWICTWPDTFIEVFIYVRQNSSFSGPTSSSTATITAAPTSTYGASAAASSSSTAMAQYPRAVKIKERRINRSPQAYCDQVEVQADGSITAVSDAGGNPVRITITENEPGPPLANSSSSDDSGDSESKRKRGVYGRRFEELLFMRDDDGDMSNCGCMWFSS